VVTQANGTERVENNGHGDFFTMDERRCSACPTSQAGFKRRQEGSVASTGRDAGPENDTANAKSPLLVSVVGSHPVVTKTAPRLRGNARHQRPANRRNKAQPGEGEGDEAANVQRQRRQNDSSSTKIVIDAAAWAACVEGEGNRLRGLTRGWFARRPAFSSRAADGGPR